jgi:sugar/nucleoside kinase (ribokinase family)
VTVLVIGDATLDVSVASTGPMVPAGDVPASIRLAPGGQGANVAVRLARRGVPVRLAAPMATDPGGRLLAGLLNAEGVDLCALAAPRTAMVVALLDAAGERSMLSDRRSIDPASAAAQLGTADWVHVSGYALADDGTGDELADAIAGRDRRVRVSVAGGSFSADPARAERVHARIARVEPDLVVLAQAEATVLLGEAASPAEAARAFAGVASIAIVTDGREGCALASGPLEMREPAVTTTDPVVDATGAGDAFAASVIAELLGCAWPPGEAELRAALVAASQAGAQVASVHGAQARVAADSVPGR